MASENNCSHCGSDCGKNPLTWGNKIFCCNGCLQVYQLLNDNKLHQYYSLSTLPGVKIDEIKYDNKYAFLENEEVIEKLYEFHNAETAKVTFYIPAIHCISCIWLLEHVNKLHTGIKQSSVNFVQKTFTATFSTSEISLRKLVELLVSIHYIPDISSVR